MEEIGLAIVGCGQFARAHLKAIENVDGVRVTAAVDSDGDRAKAVAEDSGGGFWTTDFDAALARDEVDAVVLALPHDLHLPFSVRASEAKKHVLVEKPMALTEEEGKQMVAAADAAGTRLMVGQSTRFSAPMQCAHKLIAEGALGSVVNVLHQRMFWVNEPSTGWRREQDACGGFYLPLFGSHDIDAMLWLLDESPNHVWAVVRNEGTSYAGDSDGFVGMEFADGKVASVSFSCQAKRDRTETVFVGRQATMAVTRGGVFLDDEPVDVPKAPNQIERQMEAFVGALRQGIEVPTPGSQVLRVLRVLDLAKESSATGKRMTF